MVTREPVLKLIIAYKLGRAGLAVLAAVTLVVLLLAGLDAPVREFAARLHDHAVSALAVSLSSLLMSALEPNHIVVVTVALLLDGGVLVLEGWALWKGYRWGAWLVVAASAALLPFEVVALVHHSSLARVGVLVVNLAIVAWLLQRRIRQHLSSAAVSAELAQNHAARAAEERPRVAEPHHRVERPGRR